MNIHSSSKILKSLNLLEKGDVENVGLYMYTLIKKKVCIKSKIFPMNLVEGLI
tara:strand:- start:426 stop:584 length:159 start_codon:yes stop_codon:yes gene_type:complete